MLCVPEKVTSRNLYPRGSSTVVSDLSFFRYVGGKERWNDEILAIVETRSPVSIVSHDERSYNKTGHTSARTRGPCSGREGYTPLARRQGMETCTAVWNALLHLSLMRFMPRYKVHYLY